MSRTAEAAITELVVTSRAADSAVWNELTTARRALRAIALTTSDPLARYLAHKVLGDEMKTEGEQVTA